MFFLHFVWSLFHFMTELVISVKGIVENFIVQILFFQIWSLFSLMTELAFLFFFFIKKILWVN